MKEKIFLIVGIIIIIVLIISIIIVINYEDSNNISNLKNGELEMEENGQNTSNFEDENIGTKDQNTSILKNNDIEIEFKIPEGFRYVTSGSNENVQFQIFTNGEVGVEVQLVSDIEDIIDDYLESQIKFSAFKEEKGNIANYKSSRIKTIDVDKRKIKYIECSYNGIDQYDEIDEEKTSEKLAAYDISDKYRYQIITSGYEEISIETIKDFFKMEIKENK